MAEIMDKIKSAFKSIASTEEKEKKRNSYSFDNRKRC